MVIVVLFTCNYFRKVGTQLKYIHLKGKQWKGLLYRQQSSFYLISITELFENIRALPP